MNYTYTKEQDDWLRENWTKYGSGAVEMFNEKFGQHRTYQMIRSHCQAVLKLRVSKEYKSDICRQNNKQYVPIGTTSKAKGYWQIKVADEYGNKKANWMPLHHYNYIRHYGEIPKGMVVIFLDGDKDNCDASNLKAIPQAINALLMKKEMRSIRKELTEAGIEWCELYQILQKDGFFEREQKRENERRKAEVYAHLNEDQKKAVKKIDKDGNVVKTYSGISEAARSEGISASKICACARGRRKTTGGYIWEYL